MNGSKGHPGGLLRYTEVWVLAGVLALAGVIAPDPSDGAPPTTQADGAARVGPAELVPKPLVSSPTLRHGDTLVPVTPPYYVPPARGGDIHRRGDAVRQQPLRPRPWRDAPPLATGLDSLAHWSLRPLSSMARADSPSPGGLAALWRLTGPDRAAARVSSDPTRAESGRAALLAKPKVRLTPVPFIRRTLPNPFALAEAIALRVFPPDDDPPAPPQAAPTPPTLPVAPKPSKPKR